ncbi:MAG: CFI-box-CTERM domain-containing protein [Dehalococcoidia bacterium]
MKPVFGALFCLVIVVSLGLVSAAPVLAGTIRYVPSVYPTIQEAIDAASDGDTIIVAAGLYKESIVIDKSLTLQGAQAGVDARTRSGPETIVEPGGDQIGISITTAADRVVVIDGLTVQNALHALSTAEFGPMATNITVRNVRVLNCGEFGISATFTLATTVEHCYVKNAEIAINAGALEPAPPTVAIFRNNEVINSRFGITGYLKDSLIEGNLIKDFATGGVGISGQFLNTKIRNNTVTGYVKGAGMTLEWHYYRPLSENVTVVGNNFTGNLHGIYVFDTQTTLNGIMVNFNNIADNSWRGALNEGPATLNATYNWWGDASGPSSGGPGEGDPVRGNIDFEPWLGAPLLTVSTHTVTNGRIDAKNEADTEVAVNGTAMITVVQYADNPGSDHPRCFIPINKYVHIYAPNTTEISELEIRLYYSDAEVATAGVKEESLRLFSWNGTAWVECSHGGVNVSSASGYNGYVWGKITSDSMPTLVQLTRTPFGTYGLPSLVLFIVTAQLPRGQAGTAYEAKLEACLGAEPYVWTVTQGSLPDGLSLDTNTGNISGTPTRAGTFDFTVTVTDAVQATAAAPLSISIAHAGVCFIATAAYGTDTASDIDILREFRDEILLPNSLGAKLVSFYYKTSPPIASFISRHEALRTVVRAGFVDPIVAMISQTRHLWSTRASP